MTKYYLCGEYIAEVTEGENEIVNGKSKETKKGTTTWYRYDKDTEELTETDDITEEIMEDYITQRFSSREPYQSMEDALDALKEIMEMSQASPPLPKTYTPARPPTPPRTDTIERAEKQRREQEKKKNSGCSVS